MYQKSIIRQEQVLSMYNEGISATEIATDLCMSKKTVKQLLALAGIQYTEELKKIEENKKKLVIQYYSEGKSQVWIEQELNMTRKTIRELLKKKGVEYRTNGDQQILRYGNNINKKIFDIITPESAYWIGMLYTDGHIEKSGRGYSISLTLHADDYEHLEKYRKFLGTEKTIKKHSSTNCYSFVFGSQKVHERLRELGFTNRKTDSITPHELLKNSRDFWRGCVDGDGCLFSSSKKRERKVLHLCGTYETCLEFCKFIDNNEIESKALPRKAKSVNLYQISYESVNAEKVSKLLYENAITYMERKYQKYLEFNKGTNQ